MKNNKECFHSIHHGESRDNTEKKNKKCVIGITANQGIV